RFYDDPRFPGYRTLWHDTLPQGGKRPGSGTPTEDDAMARKLALVILIAFSAAALSGCAGDPVKMMMSNPEMQTKIMAAITGNPETSGKMVDQLLGNEETRTALLDKVMANGGAAQTIMGRIAKDQTMVDGILNMAAQDDSMREHIMTLFKGMQMAKGAKAH
ncbi:MAG TPA: hypothetical protein VIX13_02345, partial [Candidatus Eisenbacteria bacterium]